MPCSFFNLSGRKKPYRLGDNSIDAGNILAPSNSSGNSNITNLDNTSGKMHIIQNDTNYNIKPKGTTNQITIPRGEKAIIYYDSSSDYERVGTHMNSIFFSASGTCYTISHSVRWKNSRKRR